MPDNDWLKEVKGQEWFKTHFGRKDRQWIDPRFPRMSPHAPSGPPDKDRESSIEKASLIIADPRLLDLHLSYSAGLERGPVIERTGDSPPIMEDPEVPGSYTTDPDLQRIGAYYINEEKKRSHIREVFYCFAGNYILYRLIDANRALIDAENILLAHFSEKDEFKEFFELLNVDKPNLGTLGGHIVNFIPSFATFLQRKNVDLVDLFAGLTDWLTIEQHATHALDAIYENAYPKPIDNFANHNQSRGFRTTVAQSMRKYLRLLILLVKTPSHEQKAKARGRGKIVLMQGCGDLTMNEWNVAFVSKDSYKEVSDEKNWDLLHPPGEPINDRTYSCLIKWHCDKSDPDLQRIARENRVVYPYQIANLRFMVPSLEVGPPNRHVFLGKKKEPIGHLIEFAVYGQQLYRDNKPLRLQSVVGEFGDIRHIYQLPDLNRDYSDEEESKDEGIQDYEKKPRNLFNQITRDSVWLGEAKLKRDRNLQVAGLTQAIRFHLRDLGAPEEWIQIVLEREEKTRNTYSALKEPDADVINRGEWRWVAEGRNKFLEIFLLPNQYPCTMIGVKAKDEGTDVGISSGIVVETEDVFFLAHGHNYNWQGCTIMEAAEYLSEQGAWNILMFDEGNDVFQLVDDSQENKLVERVPLKRNQLRCVFWATVKESKS